MLKSISEAAQRWNKSRTTLYRAVNKGLLSTNGKGKARTVNVSEMSRVYGECPVNRSSGTMVERYVTESLEHIMDDKGAVIAAHQKTIDLLEKEL